MRNPLKLRPVDLMDEPLPNVADDVEVKALLDERGGLLRRLDQANDRLDTARARANRSARRAHNVPELARRMVRGAMIQAFNPDDDVRAAEEEQDILLEAIGGIQPRLEEIVYQRSLVVAERFQQPYREALRRIFDGMIAIRDGMQTCRAITAKMTIAGYKTGNVGLPPFHLRSALVLGDPFSASPMQNEASAFRKLIEAAGVSTK